MSRTFEITINNKTHIVKVEELKEVAEKVDSIVESIDSNESVETTETVTEEYNESDNVSEDAKSDESTDNVEEEIVKSDEDVLSCALFENVAVKFLEKRNNKNHEQDETIEINLYI